MSEHWKAPRIWPEGFPQAGQAQPDTGGPCTHCPAIDPYSSERVTYMNALTAFAVLAKAVSDHGLQPPVAPPSACPICKDTRFVRVCFGCDGHGVTDKIRIDHAVEVLEDTTGVRANGMPAPRIVERKTVLSDAWQDGAQCKRCGGSGQESITADQVGKAATS